jgi:hypothetical protein
MSWGGGPSQLMSTTGRSRLHAFGRWACCLVAVLGLYSAGIWWAGWHLGGAGHGVKLSTSRVDLSSGGLGLLTHVQGTAQRTGTGDTGEQALLWLRELMTPTPDYLGSPARLVSMPCSAGQCAVAEVKIPPAQTAAFLRDLLCNPPVTEFPWSTSEGIVVNERNCTPLIAVALARSTTFDLRLATVKNILGAASVGVSQDGALLQVEALGLSAELINLPTGSNPDQPTT